MRMNGGAPGDLKKTTLRLGTGHEISIAVGADSIKAVVKEINSEGAGVDEVAE